MSKRLSSQSNTLFNYFQSPKGKSTPTSAAKSETSSSNQENVSMEVDDEVVPRKHKRIRVIDSDSDESEQEPSSKRTPAKSRKVLGDFRKDSGKNGTPENGTKQKEVTLESKPEESSQWTHHKLDFLQPNKIRDINRNPRSHPDYDERTLYVPEDFLKKQTPAMRQWWVLKSAHFDSVLFFKVGKFYELYHMDAVVGVNNLGFSYMKGEFAHSGFPESAYGRMASSLIEQGFKVARVEQTETPEMMQERCKVKKGTKFDKVVNREICQVSTAGTCVYGAQMTEAKQDLSRYMVAIAEKQKGTGSLFGVCFIDTSIGEFYLSQFQDDKHCSRLLALLAEHTPSLFLLERLQTSNATLTILKKQYSDIKKEMLTSGSQFLSASKTIETLSSGPYFVHETGELEFPTVLKPLKDDPARSENEYALKALGACLWYLKDSKLDLQLFSMRKFSWYRPIDVDKSDDKNIVRDYMVMDAVTLGNLKLLGTEKGTLERVLDRCKTAFGKRLLVQWICRPLCNLEKLCERQKAVAELVDSPSVLEKARGVLKKLPDLERQVAKIHIFGNKVCAKLHPDSRAILYEEKTYSKRKILDLLNTLRGFELAQSVSETFKDCQSYFLKKITQNEPTGLFCDSSEIIEFFKDSFDQEEAEKEGKIIPQSGIDCDYDDAVGKIKDIEEQLQEYLEEQKRFLGCKVSYFGTDKKRYQLEIPESKTHKVTSAYQLEGARKGFKRYSTSATRAFLNDMLHAEADKSKIVLDLNRRIFEKFSSSGETWQKIIQCLKMLDVLCSLAEFARTFTEDICIPNVKPFSNKPEISIKTGRHPCVPDVANFVPNDTHLGTDDSHANTLLLTGPNMGGKSTLMRQVAVIVVMAQMGSLVPASHCELTLVDRIFTRLGAQDDIMQGQSTFLLELSEASAILQHATRHSLVIVDELGRGTSTHDGNAVATAYVRKIVEMRARTMFATHYHNLVDFYAGYEGVQLGHMACMAENECEDDASVATVTFLYTLATGKCPKSYGFNAARLAGLKSEIITSAAEVAAGLERLALNRRVVAKVFNTDSVGVCRELIRSLR